MHYRTKKNGDTMFCYSNNRIYCNKYVVPLKISFLQEKTTQYGSVGMLTCRF